MAKKPKPIKPKGTKPRPTTQTPKGGRKPFGGWTR